MKREFGVYYMHDENPYYHEMCLVSIESLRQLHPDWNIEIRRTASFKIQWWRRIYRFLTPWKNHLRDNRAGQDTRMFVEKAKLLTQSPFRSTLFLDVDTVVRNSLFQYQLDALNYDLVVCAIPWLKYYGIDDSMPNEWPGVNVGVMFYSEKFSALYADYLKRYERKLNQIDMVDQYFVSLICHVHNNELKIKYEPYLQLDVIDAHHHIGDMKYHVSNGLLDLSDNFVKKYAVFHYNEYKKQYLQLWKESMAKIKA